VGLGFDFGHSRGLEMQFLVFGAVERPAMLGFWRENSFFIVFIWVMGECNFMGGVECKS